MATIKNLSVANIRNIEGMVRREDLDFSDDGNRFRGFSYKGMPITTLRSDNTTYLAIRVDYLYKENHFTGEEWRATEEYKLQDEFNGVSEIDLDKLIENLERIIAKRNELNEKALYEIIDTAEVEKKLEEEIEYAESVVEEFKSNFKWYEAKSYDLNRLADYLKSQINITKRCRITLKNLQDKVLDRRTCKELAEKLTNYGYVEIKEDSFYLREMKEAMN